MKGNMGYFKTTLISAFLQWINVLFFFFVNLFILFIYFWLCWVFVAARRFSLVGESGATLRCGERASHCGGFSHCGAWALGVRSSVVAARALEHRLSSCGTQA